MSACSMSAIRVAGTVGEAELLGALACMVGAVVLARAVDAGSSPAVLEACRAFLHDALAEKNAPARSTRRAKAE